MDMNDDILQGRWPELKSQVKPRWSKLTDADLATLSGKQAELVLALRQRYGYAQGQAVMEIKSWITSVGNEAGMTAPGNPQRSGANPSAAHVSGRGAKMPPAAGAAAVTFAPTMGRSTLTAVFPDPAEARHAIIDLKVFGLRVDQISVATRSRRHQDKLIDDTGTQAADGAASASGTEPAQGGLHGLMAGLWANIFPGNPSLVRVPAAAQVPAMPDGVIGALVGMHLTEADARQRESGYRVGSVLITAKVFEGVAEARGIMQQHGGGMVS